LHTVDRFNRSTTALKVPDSTSARLKFTDKHSAFDENQDLIQLYLTALPQVLRCADRKRKDHGSMPQAHGPSPRGPGERVADAPSLAPTSAPLCYVVDEEPSIRHFLSLVLHGAGVDTMEFADGNVFRAAAFQRAPDLVFHNISLDSADAIGSMVALGKQSFRGSVQLMSNRGAAVLEHVRSIGAKNRLNMLPVLKKPFETEAITKILRTLNLGMPPAGGLARLDLGEALASGWIEFWYQPKIDLKRKQLAGAEIYARAHHPFNGVVLPGAFMPEARPDDVVRLSELALHNALRAGLSFSKLGINLKLTVNIPVPALVQLAVGDIVRTYRGPGDTWAGLIIDVPEKQIVTDLKLASEINGRFERYNVRLAIDDFGRGYSSLARLGELPFAELKLDRAFVADCGSDKVNAPLCKTVIDLAHNFGKTAVAIGIEKAADAVALVSMGCDYGQGFLLGQPMPEERFLSLLRQRAATQGRKLPNSAPA
jgi:EAL domain-containing protein (putative c-di-GMP-specific phosphodiesterase class I)